MHTMIETSPFQASAAALGVAADLQDNLLTVTHDLERLQKIGRASCRERV